MSYTSKPDRNSVVTKAVMYKGDPIHKFGLRLGNSEQHYAENNRGSESDGTSWKA